MYQYRMLYIVDDGGSFNSDTRFHYSFLIDERCEATKLGLGGKLATLLNPLVLLWNLLAMDVTYETKSWRSLEGFRCPA